MHEDAEASKRFAAFNLLLVQDLQLGIYIGSVLAVVGFILWYFRVQKYLDRAIKKQNLT